MTIYLLSVAVVFVVGGLALRWLLTSGDQQQRRLNRKVYEIERSRRWES